MFKKFLRNCVGFFAILVVISGCEGQSCIEAEDFGEYDTDVITVDAKGGGCDWTDNSDYGEGSDVINKCLSGEKDEIKIPGLSCSIKPAGDSGKITCHELKNCVNDRTSCNLVDFKFEGSEDNCPKDKDNDSKINFIINAYQSCLEQCISNCNSGITSYEPGWEPNNLKEKNSYQGIKISSGSKIKVQAIGTVVLQGADNSEFVFPTDNKKVITTAKNKNINLNRGAPFTLTGNWCKGTNKTNSGDCDYKNQVGEFLTNKKQAGNLDNTDIAKRTDFFRRGVMILKTLPADGALSSEGVYTGPLLFPNFDAWKCSFVENDSGLVTSAYRCETDFSGIGGADSNFLQQNMMLYGMNNGFVKNVGGYVIPENVMEYITTNPFQETTCVSQFDDEFGTGYTRKCEHFNVGGFEVKSSDEDSSTTRLQNGYILTKDGKEINMLYPSKLAFKVIGAPTSSTKECTVTVSVADNSNIQNKCVKVRTDGRWHFLTDSNLTDSFNCNSSGSNKKVLLNKDDYNTLQKLKTDSNLQNLNSDRNYKVIISFNEDEKWEDSEGHEVPCGEGMAAFFLPQNEILIEKSGFVSFKNLLSNYNIACQTNNTDTNDNEKCYNSQNISFSIINPLYNHKNVDKFVLQNNFYEYKKSNSFEPEEQKVELSSSNSGWVGDIFVRKGQILRFGEDNWFDISVPAGAPDNNTYEIKNKVLKQSQTFTKKFSDGLVLRIEERPALLCMDNATEEYDNPNCIVTYDENGNGSCKGLSYADACTTESAKDRFCPFGCYPCENGECSGIFYVDSDDAEKKSVCYIDDDNKGNYPGISLATCKTCQTYIGEAGNTPPLKYEYSVVQCYDLEDYAGAVSSLTKEKLQDYRTTGVVGILKDYANTSDDKNQYGLLTNVDISLGAKKLKSIFDGGDYGTLEGMELDTTKKDSQTNLYNEFVYNSSGLNFSSPRNLSFLVLDNSDFKFDPSTSYSQNDGDYIISFTPQETVSDGAQLAVVVADKDWNGTIPSGELTASDKFKTWVVKYNTNKEHEIYGRVAADSPYEFNSNGLIVDRGTKGEGIDMTVLAKNIKGVDESEYSNLRLFFKIIDKEEKVGCKNSDDTFRVKDSATKCRCVEGYGSRDIVSCDDINGVCKTKKVMQKDEDGNVQKDEDGNEIILGEVEQIETVESNDCVDLYSNNSGKYTIQLKTAKDVLNSTGYIVKYVMEPIMEILDGKTIGIALDNNGKPIPCEISDSTYKYGGDLPKSRVGTACSMTDPLVAKYCKIAPFTAPAGKCDTCVSLQKCDPDCSRGRKDGDRVNANVFYKGKNALLPGAREKYWGESCDPDKLLDPSKKSEEYPNYCYAVSRGRCNVYIDPSKLDLRNKTFGDSCIYGDENCYQNCSTLDFNLYKSRCKFVNDGRGFVQKFYTAVVNDTGYQIILKLCFTLMVMFYGLYYLLGMADLTHGELIKRVVKIAFIYLMVGKDGWYYYNMFFVQFFKSGMDYLVFAVAGSFDDSASLSAAFIKNDFFDKSVLFSGVDKNLALMFSDQITYKIWGLLFVSFFGWLYVFLIYSSIISYIMTVANALLLYLTAQFFVSLLLAFGPIFFVLLIFEKTKGMFDKWINNLVSFSLEQIFLLTVLSLFNTLVYNIIKFVLSYRVCWRPVWVLNIPLLGRIELMNFWKATAAGSPSAAAAAVPGLFQILLIYLIADLMKNFITFMSDLGAGFGGGGLKVSDMAGGIKKDMDDFVNKNIKQPFKAGSKKIGAAIAKKTIGYKTKEEEAKEKQSDKIIRNGIKSANRSADSAVDDYKKEHAKELLNMSADKRRETLAKVRKDKFDKSISSNTALQEQFEKRKKEFAKKGIKLDDIGSYDASKFSSSNSLVGLAKNHAKYDGRILKDYGNSDDKTKAIADGKRTHRDTAGHYHHEKRSADDFSKKEIKKAYADDLKDQQKKLKQARGGLLKKTMTTDEYNKKKESLKTDNKKQLDKAMNKEEDRQLWNKVERKSYKEAKENLKTDDVNEKLKPKMEEFKEKHKDDKKLKVGVMRDKDAIEKASGGNKHSWSKLSANEKQLARIEHRKNKKDHKQAKKEEKTLKAEAKAEAIKEKSLGIRKEKVDAINEKREDKNKKMIEKYGEEEAKEKNKLVNKLVEPKYPDQESKENKADAKKEEAEKTEKKDASSTPSSAGENENKNNEDNENKEEKQGDAPASEKEEENNNQNGANNSETPDGADEKQNDDKSNQEGPKQEENVAAPVPEQKKDEE